MKHEIDALQIEVMKERGPWYKQVTVIVPVVVSIVALAFSFATTYISEKRIDREERHQTRVELRELIQRLSELPKENFLLNRKYANDPGALGFLGPLVNTENLVLGGQAANLISSLRGEVTPTEYYAVAWALNQSAQSATGERLLNRGIEVARRNPAKDFPGFMALLRFRATLYFSVGKPEAGRRIMREVLDALDRYVGNPYERANAQVSTETMWARSELTQRNCDEARQHIRSARDHLARVSVPSISLQVRTAAEAIDECRTPRGTETGLSSP
jgi:hypothetical protein